MGFPIGRREAARRISEQTEYEVDEAVLRLSWEDGILVLSNPPHYGEEDLKQAVRIARCRKAGMSLQEVRQMLGPGRANQEVAMAVSEKERIARQILRRFTRDVELIELHRAGKLAKCVELLDGGQSEGTGELVFKGGNVGDELVKTTFKARADALDASLSKRAPGQTASEAAAFDGEAELAQRIQDLRAERWQRFGEQVSEAWCAKQLMVSDPQIFERARESARRKAAARAAALHPSAQSSKLPASAHGQ